MSHNLLELFSSSFQQNFKQVPDKILIALSGGVDSMCLLDLAQEWAIQNKCQIYCATIDHHLRPNSTKEANEISSLLSTQNIPHKILAWPAGQDTNSNIESLARQARYELLSNYAKAQNISVILTAHHADDELENFFIRLSRGSGIDGLAATQAVRKQYGLKIFRPLLEASKSELITYAKAKQLKFFEDETNQDKKFLRNKIRNLLSELSDEELSKKRILQSMQHFLRAKNFFNTYIEQLFNEYVKRDEQGNYIIKFTDFINLEQEAALRLLIKILSQSNEQDYKPRFTNLEQLYQKIINKQIHKRTTFAKNIISVSAEEILFSKE